MEGQNLDTQRHLATDLVGNLKTISIIRSAGIGSEYSSALVEFEDRVRKV